MDVAYLHPFLSSIKEKAANVERVKSALATESAAEEGGAVAGDPPFPYCLSADTKERLCRRAFGVSACLFSFFICLIPGCAVGH